MLTRHARVVSRVKSALAQATARAATTSEVSALVKMDGRMLDVSRRLACLIVTVMAHVITQILIIPSATAKRDTNRMTAVSSRATGILFSTSPSRAAMTTSNHHTDCVAPTAHAIAKLDSPVNFVSRRLVSRAVRWTNAYIAAATSESVRTASACATRDSRARTARRRW